jgi:hypothetical protein
MAAEFAAQRFELGADLGEIINFAVEGNDEAAAGRDHRLRAGRRQVDDREAAMAERQSRLSIAPDIAGIRPAMKHDIGHALGGMAERFWAHSRPLIP